MQEQGWPLGLQPLNAAAARVSFSTLITASSPGSSCISSSDLDTQSTGSFFHDKSMTLGSLLGVSSFLELSRRRTTQTWREQKNNYKPRSRTRTRTWFFSLCSRLSTDAVDTNIKSHSLAHFLQVESPNICTRNHRTSVAFGPRDFSHRIESSAGDGRKSDGNRDGVPLLLSCLYPRLLH
ncbi:hypothetical protein HRI_001643300 [Hibiscus trionum]|uniref:Uncharacterized protein n=1 Tax=Hibiscus trionum TaxID=183268 RepID=A0A9W7HL04_HIBTR|nr:hypothetical protein HRI_001643300 [Hibiscus trionum]